MRLITLFDGGTGCLFVGIIVSLVTGDSVMLIMSAILCIAFVTKGVLLKRKINLGQIFCVSGVCVSIAPKMLNRYRRIELVNTDTGDDVYFILPKKVVFKVGHVYNCYFDTVPDRHFSRRPVGANGLKGGFLNAELDLPTNGFLGFEDFGVYQEKPAVAVAANVATATAADANAVDEPAAASIIDADSVPDNSAAAIYNADVDDIAADIVGAIQNTENNEIESDEEEKL
jgi:hypothetical protein